MTTSVLNLTNKLANAPKSMPSHALDIDYKGNKVTLADPRAVRSSLALMNLAAVNGGAACHWGGPSALVEMMAVVHNRMFKNKNWFNDYNFVNDVGHGENGIYALRSILGFDGLSLDSLLGFRSVNSKLTGHGESHLNPEGVLLSNGPLGSSLGQAQGLAMADKLIGNDRVTICTVSDGASMEGEAKEAFSAIAGLSRKGKLNPFVMILSDNNTKLSGRIDEDSFSMGESFNGFETLGWNVIKVDNGHDLTQCLESFDRALEESKNKPTLIWLKTIKGYPVKSTMESKSGGHGFPIKAYSEDIISFLNEINENQTPSEFLDVAKKLTLKPESTSSTCSIKKEKMQAGFARAAIEMKSNGYPVVSVSSDLQGSTGMAPFHKEHPESAFDIGIAESNMVSAAVGMSKAGFIPIVDTFAAFGVTKGNLPHIMASLSDCPLIAVYSHAGFQDAADGASHQSTTYLSAMSSIPNTKVVVVSSSTEAYELMKLAIKDIKNKREANKQADSVIFFVGRENFPATINENLTYSFDKAQIIKEGDSALIVSCGPLLHKAIEAGEKLESEGIKVSIINNACVNNADISTISSLLKASSSKLITVEDHQKIGGMGAQLIHKLKTFGVEFSSTTLGVNGEFGQSAYTANELYAKHELSVDSIIKAVKS